MYLLGQEDDVASFFLSLKFPGNDPGFGGILRLGADWGCGCGGGYWAGAGPAFRFQMCPSLSANYDEDQNI